MAGDNLGVARGSIEINTSELKNADLALRSAGGSMIQFGEMAIGAFATVISKAAEFEKEMDFVAAVTNAPVETMDKLKDAAIDLAKNSVYGPIALSEAFVELVKAGASAEDIINGVGEASVNLATAADVEIPFAGENLINILNTYKLGAEDATRVSDLLAGAANASSVSLEDIVTTMKYAGPVAQGLGIDISDVNDALSILGQVGIKGSTAGTSLRQIMLNLSPPTKKARDQLEALGIITEDGSNQFFDAEGNAKSLAEVFGILGDATKDLNNEQKTAVLRDLFGVRSIPAALELLSQGRQGFEDINDEINRTTAADVAAQRMDNLDGSIKRLKATLEAMFVEAGGPFQKMLKGWVDGLREALEFIDNLPGPLKTFIVGAVGVIGVLSLLAGAFLLTIGNIVRAVRVVGEIKNALSLFSGGAKVATAANEALGASFLLNPITLIIAAIVALIAALVLLYFHFKPFRDFIDNMWQDIQEFWDKVIAKGEEVKDWISNFFQGVDFGDPLGSIGDIWDSFANADTQGVTTELSNVFGLAEAVGVGFQKTKDDVRDAVKNIVEDLANIPGKVETMAKEMWQGFTHWMSELPTKAGEYLGNILGELTIFGIEFVKSGISIASDFVTGVRLFFLGLPAMIMGYLTAAYQAVLTWGPTFVSTGWDIGMGFLENVLVWMEQLPGMIGDFLVSAWNFAFNMVPRFISTAWDIGWGVYHGILDIFGLIPDAINGILNTAIEVFRSMVTVAFNAAKDFAGGLWDGFKEGLGIHSPSFIEEAMFAIDDQMRSSTASLASQVAKIQRISTGIPTLNESALGMTSPAVAANGGLNANTYNQNAPLIGNATIRSDQDIVLLGRQLERERQMQQRARGLAPAVVV